MAAEVRGARVALAAAERAGKAEAAEAAEATAMAAEAAGERDAARARNGQVEAELARQVARAEAAAALQAVEVRLRCRGPPATVGVPQPVGPFFRIDVGQHGGEHGEFDARTAKMRKKYGLHTSSFYSTTGEFSSPKSSANAGKKKAPEKRAPPVVPSRGLLPPRSSILLPRAF
eukprot:1112247-Prorocentrum_minimum.AAC.1